MKQVQYIYIYIQEINKAKFKETLIAENNFLNWMLNFDIDINWDLIWIEILPISLANNIEEINYKFTQKWIKLLFNQSITVNSFNIFNNNINVWLNMDWNLSSITINNIINKQNFVDKIVYEKYN